MRCNASRWTLLALLSLMSIIAAVLLAGCGPSPADFAVPEDCPEGLTLAGPWQGTWESTRANEHGAFTVTLTQQGDRLSGHLTLHPLRCSSVTHVAMQGSIQDTSVQLIGRPPAGRLWLTGRGTCGAEPLGGTYTSLLPGCAQDAGVWQARR